MENDSLDFADELAEGLRTDNYIDRNPEQKTRIQMIDLSEYAETRNLSLPGYISDHFRRCFDKNEISYKESTEFIDKLSMYTSSRGYSWLHEYPHKERVPISVFRSDTEKTKAFITESHDESKTSFYTAILFENGKETQLCKSYEYTDCQKKIGEHFFLISLDELSKTKQEQQMVKDLVKCVDKQKVKDLVEYAENQKIRVPERTQQRWEELLRKGEKIDNIRSYIDDYSRGINGPGIEVKKKEKDKVQEVGIDI